MASTDIEILLTKLVSLLYDIDAIKTPIDKAIYDYLRDDISAYIGIIDEKQNKLLEAHDGEVKSGVGRTSAFKKVLNVALYGIVYNSLYFASVEYRNYTPSEEIKKDNRLFLRLLFLIMSINLSTLGGVPRRKGVGLTAQKNINIRSMFKKPFEDKVREEYKERYGEELPPTEDFQDLDYQEDEEI